MDRKDETITVTFQIAVTVSREAWEDMMEGEFTGQQVAAYLKDSAESETKSGVADSVLITDVIVA